jgi:hypothetical protein
MRYLYIAVFNLIVFYALGVFVFAHGGVLDNLNKMYRVSELRFEKYQREIELEKMKARLAYLRTTQLPDLNILAQKGRKVDNSVIFRFSSALDENYGFSEALKIEKRLIRARIFVFLGIICVFLIGGNIILIAKLES